MQARLGVSAAVLGFLAMAVPALAHHSFAAQFDSTKPVVLKGAVTRVEFRNPHIWVYLDVKGDDGKVTPWQCEGGAPNALTRQGWNRNTLGIGAEIIVDGFKAKDGTNTCNARVWRLPDGKTVFAGSADSPGAPPARGNP
ncbi:MAG: DUF6152 family protein [Vicinamibacterales bacterium]